MAHSKQFGSLEMACRPHSEEFGSLMEMAFGEPLQQLRLEPDPRFNSAGGTRHTLSHDKLRELYISTRSGREIAEVNDWEEEEKAKAISKSEERLNKKLLPIRLKAVDKRKAVEAKWEKARIGSPLGSPTGGTRCRGLFFGC